MNDDRDRVGRSRSLCWQWQWQSQAQAQAQARTTTQVEIAKEIGSIAPFGGCHPLRCAIYIDPTKREKSPWRREEPEEQKAKLHVHQSMSRYRQLQECVQGLIRSPFSQENIRRDRKEVSVLTLEIDAVRQHEERGARRIAVLYRQKVQTEYCRKIDSDSESMEPPGARQFGKTRYHIGCTIR
jgi:hypothetical protein